MKKKEEDTSSLPGPSQVWSPWESSSAGPWGFKSHGGMAERDSEEELGGYMFVPQGLIILYCYNKKH